MKPATHLQNLPSSYIREILGAATSGECISLAGGLPSEALFPYQEMSAIFKELADNTHQYTPLFQYGLTSGHPELIEHLSKLYALHADQDVFITNGSQQGIDLVARTFLDPSDEVLMEAPSYLGAIQAFALTQACIRSVEQHANGPDVNQVETIFKKGKCKLFYAVPDFHNPSGVCWSVDVRQQIAQLCKQYNVLFLEDAPYRDLRFSGVHLPLVSEFCPENAIVLRSYSKTTVPGLRLGSLVSPKTLLPPLIRVKQAVDLHTNLPLQHVLFHLLTDAHYPQHIEKQITVYRSRYTALCQALDQELPHFGHYEKVEGGMFVWFCLHQGNADALAKRALEQGVAVVPGSVFYREQNINRQALRLNFSHSSETNITTAVSRLKSSMGM